MSKEVANWIVGNGLLNGGKKLKPELSNILAELGVTVKSVQPGSEGSGQDMVSISAPEATMKGLAVLLKGKLHMSV
jgi:hypothetical protein